MLLSGLHLPRGISRVVCWSTRLEARTQDFLWRSGASTRFTDARGVHVPVVSTWLAQGSLLFTGSKCGPLTTPRPADSVISATMGSGFLRRTFDSNYTNDMLAPASAGRAPSSLDMLMIRACVLANPVRVVALAQKETSKRRLALSTGSTGRLGVGVLTHDSDIYASMSTFAASLMGVAMTSRTSKRKCPLGPEPKRIGVLTHDSESFASISSFAAASMNSATSRTSSAVSQPPGRVASFAASIRGASTSASASASTSASTSASLSVASTTEAGVQALHIPVLLDQVLECFRGRDLNTFIDGTVGAGGHTCALLKEHPELTRVLALDVDPTAHAITAARLKEAFPNRVHLVQDELLLSDTGNGKAWAAVHGDRGSCNGSSEACISDDATVTSSLRSSPSHSGSSLDCSPSNLATPGSSLGALRSNNGAECTSSSSGRRSGSEGAETSGWHTTVHLRYSNFRNIETAALLSGIGPGNADAILLDIGVSSMQIDSADRGFSFMRDGPLDMRMDPQNGCSAEFIVNEWPEDQLGVMLRDLGEERNWRQLARRIVNARRMRRIETTQQLADVLSGGRPASQRHSSSKHRGKVGLHPATRSFQALRIAVNAELDSLALAIPAAAAQLAPGGCLAIISFHSLEDRIVKHTFLELSGKPREEGARNWGANTVLPYGGTQGPKVPGEFKVVTKKPLEASEDEASRNPRSRSAKLRILERLR